MSFEGLIMRPQWVVIVINGILAWPGSSKGWTDRAVTWVMCNLPAWGLVCAEKYEYFRGILFRWAWRQSLVDGIAGLMDSYHASGKQVCVVAHSNGCDLALRAVRDTGASGVVLHLIAGAADPDFERNGLNRLLADGTVARVHWWRCGKDVALNWLAPATRVATATLAGFQSGGSIQPESAYSIDPAVRPSVAFHDYPDFGHSDLLSTERLPKTLTKILDHLSTEAA